MMAPRGRKTPWRKPCEKTAPGGQGALQIPGSTGRSEGRAEGRLVATSADTDKEKSNTTIKNIPGVDHHHGFLRHTLLLVTPPKRVDLFLSVFASFDLKTWGEM